MNDYVRVKDKADPSVVHKVPKLLLQVSIGELHNDLIEQLPEASKDGIPLISDNKLREMIPPQLKQMTDQYKEMCGCTDCASIGYFHCDNNTYTTLFGTELKKTRDCFLPGSLSWTHANEKLTAFDEPVDNTFPDLVHYDCAKGACQRSPNMPPHPVLMRSNITFHAYKVVTACTKHGVLSLESNGCC